jgi:small subunit ribosomal protein S18
MAEHRGGRPIAASQRPTGTDKAIATGKKQYFRRKKVDRICLEKIDYIDYKDVRLLSQFITERGKIIPRRISGLNALNQRRIAEAIAVARNIALLPFAGSPGHAAQHPPRRVQEV